MPTYEYLCQTCSHRFEKWQKMTDEALTICPECGGHIRRVFFPAGIVFKGSGFYKTDHRSPSSNGADANAPVTKSENDTAATTAGESKTGGESKSTSTESSSHTTNDNKVPTPAATTK